MKTLIFGARGQLGKELVDIFKNEGHVFACDLPEIDIRDGKVVEDVVSAESPDVVINAAAYTDVEKAEFHPQEAFDINEKGVRNVAIAAAKKDIPFVHYSTDFVFSGDKNAPYEPDDPPSPQGVYAQSKYAGERALIETTKQFFIIRTAWLFGLGKTNFVEKILQAALTHTELRVVDDEIGSPTYTRDLAYATLLLVRTGCFGVYHIVNSGQCSRFELAQAILEIRNISVSIVPCKAAEWHSAVIRPKYSVLSNARFEQVTGHKMRHWKEALREYLARRMKFL